MDLFVVDTAGTTDQPSESKLVYSVENEGIKNEKTPSKDKSSKEKKSKNLVVEDEDDEKYENYFGLPPPSVDIFEIFKNPRLSDEPLYVSEPEEEPEETDLDIFCRAMGWTRIDGVLRKKPLRKPKSKKLGDLADLMIEDVHKSLTETDVAKEMKTSVMKDMETKQDFKQPSEREAYRARKAEASKTKGKNWYNMPATEMTDELRQDMEVIQMRSVLNPKHFYKKNDMKVLPKYFQVGTVLPSPLDRYHERGERVSKKRSLVDELLEDAEFQQFNKRKYNEVMAEQSRKGFKKAYKNMKKLKKKS